MRSCLFLLLPILAFAKPLEVQIETPYAILMNAKTGAILFEKNAKDEVFPASTTKVASTLYVLKLLSERLSENVKCSPSALKMTNEQAKKASNFSLPAHWLEPDGTSFGLVVGEEMSVKDLLFGALIVSGNDASNLLAEYVNKDISAFMDGLNAMATELGCIKTHFMNPHGLPHPAHLTCARDMAIMTREALKYPIFREIVSTRVYMRPKTNKQPEKELFNSNALLRPASPFFYPKAFGIKTGTTKLGKSNLVAAAADGDRELILVLHKSPNSKQRYRDAMQIFDKAFSEKLCTRLLFAQGDTSFARVLPKAAGKLVAAVEHDVIYKYYPSEEESLRTELHWLRLPLPIQRGQKVAEIHVIGNEGRRILVEPLFASSPVYKKWYYHIYDGFRVYYLLGLSPLLLLLRLKRAKKSVNPRSSGLSSE